MAELSIIEFLVYGMVAYSGLVALTLSAFKDLPATRSQSTIRSIWLIAPIICMFLLASAGAQINLGDNTITDDTTGGTFTENKTITFVQPVWVTLHYLFFIMLILYFIWNMLQLFTKRE
jgi:hypothetical protein